MVQIDNKQKRFQPQEKIIQEKIIIYHMKLDTYYALSGENEA